MKPPICEVCNDRFDADSSYLISFVSDAGTDAFDERAEQPGFVGHRPNIGWFCPVHVAQARSCAGSMTLPDALRDVLWSHAAQPATPQVTPPASEVARPGSGQHEIEPAAPVASPELLEPLEPGPDLDGVDLRGGVIQPMGNEGESAIAWELAPIENATAQQLFHDLLPALFEQLELGSPPVLETTSQRQWNPMDGAQAPDCPYVDVVQHEALRADGRIAVAVSSDQAHWNDNDISNVSSYLFMNVEGGRVSAWTSGRGDHDRCTSLTLRRPTSGVVVDAITTAFAAWLRLSPPS